MLEFFNNDRDPLQATFAQHYSLAGQPQLAYPKTSGSRGVSSTALTGRSHTQQSTTASSAVPGMTYTTTSYSGSTFVGTSQASVVGQYYGFNEDSVPRTMPVAAAAALYQCPFSFLGCTVAFREDEPRWMAHTDTHFQGKPFPQQSICCFCDMIFDNPDRKVCWDARMRHVGWHHRRGDTLERSKPDHCLMRYMYDQRLMSQTDYSAAQSINELPEVFGPGELGFNNGRGPQRNSRGQRRGSPVREPRNRPRHPQ